MSATIATAAALALAVATPAMAHSAAWPVGPASPTGHVPAVPSVTDPVAVGPNQFFVGVVNDATTDARIAVMCDVSGTTGHPRPGQSVAVLPASGSATSPTGFTGAAGKVIGVGLGVGTGPRADLQLGFYQVREPIPTSLLMPCAGSGLVSFVPAPASTTSHPATVKVTFVSLVA